MCFQKTKQNKTKQKQNKTKQYELCSTFSFTIRYFVECKLNNIKTYKVLPSITYTYVYIYKKGIKSMQEMHAHTHACMTHTCKHLPSPSHQQLTGSCHHDTNASGNFIVLWRYGRVVADGEDAIFSEDLQELKHEGKDERTGTVGKHEVRELGQTTVTAVSSPECLTCLRRK